MNRVDLVESVAASRFKRADTDMELKKSISETESALRSYGAVSETAWTTDKGEPHAPKHDADSVPGAMQSSRCVRLRFTPGENPVSSER